MVILWLQDHQSIQPVLPTDTPQTSSLPTLPPFPSEPSDLYAIEKAQAAFILGPFKRADLDTKALELGTMSEAQVFFAKQFLGEKMGMTQDMVASFGITQACFTDRDCLLPTSKVWLSISSQDYQFI